MEDLSSSTRMHRMTMTNRKNCTINGVNDVLSFDIHEILLETEQGMLMIKGDDLHVSRHRRQNRQLYLLRRCGKRT